jgi:dihydrolipoamide dehydrogenase
MTKTYDMVIVGAGPGGYVSAIRAAQLGLKTAIVEREHLGGICLNWGCIPTKALLRSAEIYRFLQTADKYGLRADNVGFDIQAVIRRSREVASRLNGGVSMLLKKNSVDIIWGQAKLAGNGLVNVSANAGVDAPGGTLEPGMYHAGHIIIATGARPLELPGMEIDGEMIWSYREAMKPTAMPKSLVIVGAGAIGIEFASFYNAMGVDVTVIELRDQVLPSEDAEIAGLAHKALRKQGMQLLTGTKVTGVLKRQGSLEVTVQDAGGKTRSINAERMISAVGMTGNTEGLGLEQCGVKLQNGLIDTDARGRTSVPGIYAIGDVAGLPMLAHKAEHQGVLCVEAIAGRDVHELDRRMIPACTYCHPQVASVGLSEANAKSMGYDTRVGRFPFAGNGKAIAMGEPEGLIKTIYDRKSGRLLGAHMIGAEVTELIQGYVVAMNLETTEQELMQTVFPHPTLSEMIHESTLDAYGRAIHV